MFSNTITLFNYHANTDKWYPTVITGVHYEGTTQKGHTAQAGFTNDDAVTVFIQCQSDKTLTTSAGEKSYTEIKEYAECENPESCYTFNPQCDFIYVGEWADLTPIDASEEEIGLYHEMNKAYDGIYMVNSVSFYKLIPHFEIGGR